MGVKANNMSCNVSFG